VSYANKKHNKSLQPTDGRLEAYHQNPDLDSPWEDVFKRISNFIETVILRYVEEHEYADELEMAEIRGNEELNLSIKRGIRDAKVKRGNFV